CWPSQLPLAEAHAPQAKGVHARSRHGEAPTVADAVIETKKGKTRCPLDLHIRSCHSSSARGPLERRRPRRPYPAVDLTTVGPLCCQPARNWCPGGVIYVLQMDRVSVHWPMALLDRCSAAPITGGYCWSTPFKVLEVHFLGEVCSAFLPSKKACWAHQFRYLG